MRPPRAYATIAAVAILYVCVAATSIGWHPHRHPGTSWTIIPVAPTTPGPVWIHWRSGDPAGAAIVVRGPDGTELGSSRLPDNARLKSSLADSVSPDGRLLAYLTGRDLDHNLIGALESDLSITVWDMPGGRLVMSMPLTNTNLNRHLLQQAGDLEYDSALAYEDVIEAINSCLGCAKWSPDGQRLAVVAATDGGSSDLYVAIAPPAWKRGSVTDTTIAPSLVQSDTQTSPAGRWSLKRVTDDPDHIVHFDWSPDSKWLVYEGATHSSRASGLAVGQLTRSVSADGTTQHQLFSGTSIGRWNDGSGAAQANASDSWVDAWLGDHDLVLHLNGNGCGMCTVIRADASTGMTDTLLTAWEGSHIAVDPTTGMVGAVGAQWLTLKDGVTANASPQPVRAATALADRRSGSQPARLSSQGMVLIDAESGEIEDAAHVSPKCGVDAWGLAEWPLVTRKPSSNEHCVMMAVGPGNKRHVLTGPNIPPILAGPAFAAVSPDSSWRVIHGPSGLILFDDANRAVAHANGPVRDVVWSPSGRWFVWLQDDRLMRAEVPVRLADGAPPTERELAPTVLESGWADDSLLDIAWGGQS